MTKIGSLALGLMLLLTQKMNGQSTFKTKQLSFERVAKAYDAVWPVLRRQLDEAGAGKRFEIFLQAFKAEGKLELWLKAPAERQFRLFRTYDFCARSGTLGPKLAEGDLQTPEGFYKINAFNPLSAYHLSLGIDYPNAADLFRSGGRPPGGDIYIHGNCVTVGCIPLTDEKIREVYVMAVEARASGQDEIPVFIFPFKMEPDQFRRQSKSWPAHQGLWKQLEPAYKHFREHHTLPRVAVGRTYKVIPAAR
ncbi:hypothetical protein C7T94_16540 [Pedobacter yulinensis]|uniref:L,D-TPase catalytic domain-containing protein n=1 Tax=Pedobacter yulinensis TaxID=2126353 RepID=A0A2T3HIW5_9SPHI|nr:L,D-transpeptidase family protein [Pedobacter yulinensis]PST82384.1 hypothetical protein C7T94_16540 [Pedobacter yulinensis]